MSDCHKILIRIKKDDPDAYALDFDGPVSMSTFAKVIADILSRMQQGEFEVEQEEHPELIVTPKLGGSDDILN